MLGLRSCRSRRPLAPTRQQWACVGCSAPWPRFRLETRAALRLGWSFKYAMELDPVVATEAQAFIIRGGASLTLSPTVQLAALVESGWGFGFDGDGAKYLNRGTLGVRWIPGSETSWFNL
ncbi:MAG: hypothetical protein ACI9VR_000841 [Cognaticolwellia sp.]|jgi:hypothetical protein